MYIKDGKTRNLCWNITEKYGYHMLDEYACVDPFRQIGICLNIYLYIWQIIMVK